MKVAFLTTRIDRPSARFRFLQYLPFLKGAGLEVQSHVIPEGTLKRRALFKVLSDYDVVFLQKRLFGALDFAPLRKNSKRLVFDLDDAVMYNDSKKGSFDSPRRMRRFLRTTSGADLVIAGNAYLAELARAHNKNTRVIPTSVSTQRYTPGKGPSNDPLITLGWIGSSATLFYLERIRGALDELHSVHPETVLKVVSDSFFSTGNDRDRSNDRAGGPPGEAMPVMEKKWAYDDEPGDVRSFDIGLMPLTSDPFSRGKCGLKLLQYMASGVVPVASAVGVNSEIVEHGRNGLLVNDDKDGKEWVECLSTLIKDKALRARLGKAARVTVLERYSLEVNAPKLLKALEDACEGAVD